MICEGGSYMKNPGSEANEVPNMFYVGLSNYTSLGLSLEEQSTETEECSTKEIEADLDAV